MLEKIIKAELIRDGWELERTHDLERLRLELEERKSDLEPLAAALCDDLAEAYFSDRTPVLTWKTRTGRSCAGSFNKWRSC